VCCFLLWDKPKVVLSQDCGVSIRTAEFWIDGTHPPSGKAIKVVFAEIINRLLNEGRHGRNGNGREGAGAPPRNGRR
jgi:hypothetical protein